MSFYRDRLFAGPDVWGRTYTPEPVAHCAAYEDRERLAKIAREMRQAERRKLRRAA